MKYKIFFIIVLIVVVLGLLIIRDIGWDPAEKVYEAYYIFLSIIVSSSLIIFSIFPPAHIKASQLEDEKTHNKKS
jgi:hypothetical protein